jgi:hypothetical protein
MYLCYIDESGTADIPGNTSHFVLAGLSIPIWHWRAADRDISRILGKWGLAGQEMHTAWILRPYREQSVIPNFQNLTWDQRRATVQRERNRYLLDLQKTKQRKLYQQQRKNFVHTKAYIHLTRDERKSVVREIADCVSGWGYARLFAECIDKLYFDPTRAARPVDEQAFEQVVSRFEQYLANVDGPGDQRKCYGLIVHDNNETVAKKHTDLMRRFHQQGTLFTTIERIIETPLFVDSRLTSMVQIADLCCYALRRYLENQETELFARIFTRADRKQSTVVGVRHYAPVTCTCEICRSHRPPNLLAPIPPGPAISPTGP